jgi:hypothetical protein
MNKKLKIVSFNIILVLLSVSAISCASNSNELTSQRPANPTTQSELSLPGLPEIPTPPSELPVNRVVVAYFHMTQRCATCICFEQRVDYVVRTYFQNELVSGKLSFHVYTIGNNSNVDTVKKYNALGSQLFINTVTNNIDHIKDIQDIWDWHCPGDNPGFDNKVKVVINQSLDAVK